MFISLSTFFSENTKKPASIRISPNTCRLNNDSLFS